MATVRDFPQPPRLTGQADYDLRLLEQWFSDFFQASNLRHQNTEARVDAAAAITPLETTATLADVIAKVNELITALQET